MKHKGSTNYLSHLRTAEMAAVCSRLIAECSRIHMQRIYDQVVSSTSSRFWVTPHRAAAVISRLIRGHPFPPAMPPLHREMFAEIHRRVSGIRISIPHLTLLEACRIAVRQRAPKFYVSTGYAKICILEHRKKQRKLLTRWAARKAEKIKAALGGNERMKGPAAR